MKSDSLVQSLWIGGRLSAMGRLSVASFLAHGHDYHLYCYDHVDGAPPGTVFRDAREILPTDQVHAYKIGFGAGSYSLASNFFRYKMLLDRGGWWVDTDVVCIRPFDFPSASVLASELRAPDEGGVAAASSVIKQPPGTELMRWAWRVCLEKDPAVIQWGEVGPRLLEAAITAVGRREDVVSPEVFSPVPYYEWRRLIEPDGAPELTPDVHAVHLWHQKWRAENVDPDGAFPDACLYERLKRRFGIG